MEINRHRLKALLLGASRLVSRRTDGGGRWRAGPGLARLQLDAQVTGQVEAVLSCLCFLARPVLLARSLQLGLGVEVLAEALGHISDDLEGGSRSCIHRFLRTAAKWH